MMFSFFARHSPLAAAVLVACTWASPASAGLFDDEEARKAIVDLRTRVEANRIAAEQAASKLQQSLDELSKKGSDDAKKQAEELASLRRSLLDLTNQNEALRAELAKVRGANEQVAKDLADAQKRQRDAAQGLDDRLKKFEPSKVTVDGKDFFVDAAERRDFEAALAAFRRGDFNVSETGFSELIKRYPNSGYAASALFWLGNAQYATKDYKDAVASFRDMVKRAPDHPRASEAMLSMANSLIELKDTRAARTALTDLQTQYPQSEAAAAGRERLKTLK